MVSRSQFLERQTLIPIHHWVLEGLSHRGEGRPPLLIVPPPPDQGGMNHAVLAEVSWAVATAGFPTLRFNFRGVEASQGARGADPERLEDCEAALRAIAENTGVASVTVSSFGGSARTILALHQSHPGISGLCLISPSEISPADWARVRVPILVIVGEKNPRIPLAALAASASEAGGRLQVIEDADAALSQNLSNVGRAVVGWMNEMRSRPRSTP